MLTVDPYMDFCCNDLAKGDRYGKPKLSGLKKRKNPHLLDCSTNKKEIVSVNS